MKKAIGILISMVLTVGMIGCGANVNSNKPNTNEINQGQAINSKKNVEKANSNTEEENNAEQVNELEQIINDMELTNIIAKYDVKEGKIVYKDSRESEELSDEDITKHNMIWERVKRLWPKSYMEKIQYFLINTDGKENTAGEVIAVNDQYKKYILLMDIKDSIGDNGKLVGADLDHTVVHEFAHILTLNHSQMMEQRNENSKNYTTDEGTLKDGSYLNEFYQKFWTSIYDEWKEIDKKATKDTENADDIRYEFYEKYAEQFVSDYAATNPGEDIAESFANFVLKDEPTGNSIKEQKILFFYDFDEAVQLREEIRNSLK